MRRERRRIGRLAALAATLALVLAARGALAHEGHRHEARGTVQSLHENRLELALLEGGTQEFVLSESTKYRRGDQATTRDDIVVGERAVVTYETKDGAHRAYEVRLGKREPGG